MYQIDFQKKGYLHFIGIGGISMSGLAEVLLSKGFRVSGSDAKASPLTEKLASLGAEIRIGQCAENIRPDMDCVVYTAAIHPDNPEWKAAHDAGIPMLTRAELLGELMKNYQLPIAVAGTHGKTTTTSMASHILMRADMDPTISVGGILPSIGGNIRIGQSQAFLTEACEYTNSFLSFFPKVAIILNIDADHLDFFKDLDDIASSFRRFAQLLPDDGTLIIGKDSEKYAEVADNLSCNVVTFSLKEQADYTAAAISYDESGCASFDCLERGTAIGHFTLKVPGIHNISNALAAIALGRTLDLSPEIIAEGLASFTGTERRFEYKGSLQGAVIIDDYAHHPTEIRATMDAAKNYPHKKLRVVFQSHTYTRTKALMSEFAEALSLADQVILPDIYPARETDNLGISSDTLRAEIEKRGTEALYLPSFNEIEEYLRSTLCDGDLLITMGAGNVVEVGEDLLKS